MLGDRGPGKGEVTSSKLPEAVGIGANGLSGLGCVAGILHILGQGFCAACLHLISSRLIAPTTVNKMGHLSAFFACF